jgi:hypothetical protein
MLTNTDALIAQLAATLLSHRDHIEPHHARAAAATARMIISEVCADEPAAPDVAAANEEG